jgi:hypothetical protein
MSAGAPGADVREPLTVVSPSGALVVVRWRRTGVYFLPFSARQRRADPSPALPTGRPAVVLVRGQRPASISSTVSRGSVIATKSTRVSSNCSSPSVNIFSVSGPAASSLTTTVTHTA